MTMQSTHLQDTLNDFGELANSTPRIRQLLNGWEPTLVVQSRDDSTTFSTTIRNQDILPWQSGDMAADHQITLCAQQDVLEKIFTGKLNPARAHLDGTLEVFADDRDQVKLDAISLILWGI